MYTRDHLVAGVFFAQDPPSCALQVYIAFMYCMYEYVHRLDARVQSFLTGCIPDPAFHFANSHAHTNKFRGHFHKHCKLLVYVILPSQRIPSYQSADKYAFRGLYPLSLLWPCTTHPRNNPISPPQMLNAKKKKLTTFQNTGSRPVLRSRGPSWSSRPREPRHAAVAGG